MNLVKAIGTIGGLTMVSRVLGFARDMIGSRILGASHANDAFNVAFTLPNIFRRLFGEGAFASGFVPLFSRRLASGGPEDAQKFSNEILAVFMPTLLIVTAIFMVAMPGFLWLIVSDYAETPGKFELAVELTRWTFPYLIFISLVALLSGVLNSLTRFAIAAFAPALLNIALIVGLLVSPGGSSEAELTQTVRNMAIAVLAGGVAQFALCWWAVRKAGIRLHFGRPKLTPAVKELLILILPATVAAGVYQISQLFYTFFASGLGEGALTNLGYADRLNQLPLSIIGTALGTAILPSISRAIEKQNEAGAADIQARAFDLAMLLTLPATIALSVTAIPIIGALFQGGNYTQENAVITGNILSILVLGLPAYVLVPRLLRPQGREDAGADRDGDPRRQHRGELRSDPVHRHLQPRDRHLGRGVAELPVAVRDPCRARPLQDARLAGLSRRAAADRRRRDGRRAVLPAKLSRRHLHRFYRKADHRHRDDRRHRRHPLFRHRLGDRRHRQG